MAGIRRFGAFKGFEEEEGLVSELSFIRGVSTVIVDTVDAVRNLAFRWNCVRIYFEVCRSKIRVFWTLNGFRCHVGHFGKWSKSTPKSQFWGSKTVFSALVTRHFGGPLRTEDSV